MSSQLGAVKASTMMHDFAVTDRNVVFWEMPVQFGLQLAVRMVNEKRSPAIPFVWTREYGAAGSVAAGSDPGGSCSAARFTSTQRPAPRRRRTPRKVLVR